MAGARIRVRKHNRSQARLLSNDDDSSLTTFVSYLLSQVDRIAPAAGCSGIQSPGIPCLDSTIAAPCASRGLALPSLCQWWSSFIIRRSAEKSKWKVGVETDRIRTDNSGTDPALYPVKSSYVSTPFLLAVTTPRQACLPSWASRLHLFKPW